MSRKQRLTAGEQDELLKALQAASQACKKVQSTVPVYSDIYDAACYALFNMDSLAEAVTGERRALHKMPFRK
jgi:hypothetical protein